MPGFKKNAAIYSINFKLTALEHALAYWKGRGRKVGGMKGFSSWSECLSDPTPFHAHSALWPGAEELPCP